MTAILANGLAGNDPIEEDTEAFAVFTETLREMCVRLARMVAKDGEGATKLLVCNVTGAASDADARTVAKGVICSSLLKAAMFGADANWGRVLCAIGYSGAPVDIHRVDVGFASKAGRIDVCVNGAGIPFDEEMAKKVLSEDEIDILVTPVSYTHLDVYKRQASIWRTRQMSRSTIRKGSWSWGFPRNKRPISRRTSL